ncbi:MAG: hypothetical protein DIU78_003460, partial [Pseudomonadota bacterium]
MATEADKVNVGALATLISVIALGVVGVSLAVTALTRDEMATAAAEKDATARVEYEKLSREQRQKLAEGVPIEQAMQAVLTQLKQDPDSASPPPPAPSLCAPLSASALSRRA